LSFFSGSEFDPLILSRSAVATLFPFLPYLICAEDVLEYGTEDKYWFSSGENNNIQEISSEWLLIL
jgi:hypothetical protein